MLNYTLRRVGVGLAAFFCVTALVFLLFFVRGGEALAHNFMPIGSTPEQIHAAAEELGLLRPLHTQYLEWLGFVFSGGLGHSFGTGAPVLDTLMIRLPVTLSLVIVSLIITVIVSVPFGVIAATRGGAADRVLQVLAVVVQAIPGYWLALILVIVFGLTLRLFPATGYVPLTDSFVGWLSSIILPCIAISSGAVAYVAMQIRGSMLDVMRQDYIRTLRSRGVGGRTVIYKHALRNASAPTLTILSLQVIGLLTGTVIVERIYALPGIGSLALQAGHGGDVPVVLGVVAIMVVIIILVNVLTDVVIGIVSPKVRSR